MLNCDIDAWECACLNKKFIYKEHVKLLMETNPLKLRLNFDSLRKNLESEAQIFFKRNDFKNAKKCYWYIIKSVMFTNQILENMKKQIGLSASSDTCYNLYHSIVHSVNQIV